MVGARPRAPANSPSLRAPHCQRVALLRLAQRLLRDLRLGDVDQRAGEVRRLVGAVDMRLAGNAHPARLAALEDNAKLLVETRPPLINMSLCIADAALAVLGMERDGGEVFRAAEAPVGREPQHLALAGGNELPPRPRVPLPV